MATHSKSGVLNNFALDLHKMVAEVEKRIVTTTAQDLIDESDVLASSIEAHYNDLLNDVLPEVIGMEATPAILATYLRGREWTELTRKWASYKAKVRSYGATGDDEDDKEGTSPNNYYRGITGLPGLRNYNGTYAGRKNKKPKKAPKKRSGTSFKDYMYKRNVEQLFGPVDISYSMRKDNRNFIVEKGSGDFKNSLENVEIKSTFDPNRIVAFSKFQLKAQVQVFSKLAGRRTMNASGAGWTKLNIDNEWDLIDTIIRRLDSSGKQQWMKINGRGGNGTRPIRAFVGPMIRWFMDHRVKTELNAFIKRLS